MLKKSEILSATVLPSEVLDIPEWHGKVRIRVMSGAERDAFDIWGLAQRENKADGWRNMRARMVCLCALDPDTGERMFGDNEIEAVGKLDWRALDRIYQAANRLNRLTSESVDDAEKNFDSDQTGASS